MLQNDLNILNTVSFLKNPRVKQWGFSFRYKEKRIHRHKPEERVLSKGASRQQLIHFASFVSVIVNHSSEKTESTVHRDKQQNVSITVIIF